MRFHTAVLAIILSSSVTCFSQEKILFIRGGDGTVGFFEGGANEQGASIFDYRISRNNHSWGELNAALVAEGFSLEETTEDPVADTQPLKTPTPVPLDTMNLDDYKIIVFGSNNAEYTAAQVNALKTYIFNGGSALFISDANFGQNWPDAPSSDQHFLDEFGLTMNQDQGTYSLFRADDYLVPAHPILNGIDRFDGEGVSPITRGNPPMGISTTILTKAKGNVRRNRDFNPNNNNQGVSTANTADDGTLVVGTYGSGRFACHFDRNTFFNLNGAGTNINRFDNEKYARNLFNWLAQKPDFNPNTDNYAPRVYFPSLANGFNLSAGESLAVNALAKDPDSTISYVELLVDDQLVSRITTAPYSWDVSNISAGNRVLKAIAGDSDGNTTETTLDFTVTGVSNSDTPLNRAQWSLSSSVNNTQTGNTALPNAIDGDLTTRWATTQFQTPGQTFRINLGSRQLFQRILLETPNDPSDYPRGYTIRASNDNSTFTTIASGTPSGSPTEILLPEPVTYQYIEIEQTGSSPNRWWSIAEINIYKPAANTVLSKNSWLQFHFGDALNDPSQQSSLFGDTADADQDGLTTIEEFAFNTDPNIKNDSQIVVGIAAKDDSDGQPVIDLTYRQWTGGSGTNGIDYRSNGITYSTEFSQTLEESSWSLTDVSIDQIGDASDNNDGTETVTMRLKKSSPVDKGFGRVKINN